MGGDVALYEGGIMLGEGLRVVENGMGWHTQAPGADVMSLCRGAPVLRLPREWHVLRRCHRRVRYLTLLAQR